jgi:uncharacterized protein
MLNQPASLFDDLASADGGAQPGPGGWAAVRARLDSDVIALTPPLLSEAECREARAWFGDPGRFRSTVVMQRHGFGRGTYRYFADPLPGLVAELRERLYPPLAHIANEWAARLGERRFPVTHGELTAQCAAAGQVRPTPLLLHYGPGDHANLHQDLYGDIVFPLQVAIMLSKPGEEFDGGGSVFVEQRPRSQSRAIIARPGPGPGDRLPGAAPPRTRQPRVPAARDTPRNRRRHAGTQDGARDHLPQRPLTPGLPARPRARRHAAGSSAQKIPGKASGETCCRGNPERLVKRR